MANFELQEALINKFKFVTQDLVGEESLNLIILTVCYPRCETRLRDIFFSKFYCISEYSIVPSDQKLKLASMTQKYNVCGKAKP